MLLWRLRRYTDPEVEFEGGEVEFAIGSCLVSFGLGGVSWSNKTIC